MIDPRPSAHCIMVLGTGRGAGVSWLVTALCRWYARQGLRVAPFKAQYAGEDQRTVDAGQIGPDQYLQALAARAKPDVRMNPVLMHSEPDGSCEVTLLGEVQAELTKASPHERDQALWPQMVGALDALRAAYDVLVIDGGSAPADNTAAARADLALAEHADARVLLIADIDRGGAFAHLYGTWMLLDASQRLRIAGFVLNRFRGDAGLLAPAPALLQERTGVPTVATIPMRHADRLYTERGEFEATGSSAPDARITVAILRGPNVGNTDEFRPLQRIPDLCVIWAERPDDLTAVDWIVLPGSTDTTGDLAWMRAGGLDRAICAHAAAGGAVLGICAGLQLLGEALTDPEHIDGNAAGLGLLPLVTRFEPQEKMERTQTTFGQLHGAWQALSGLAVEGYQVHHGQTDWAQVAQHPAMAAAGDVARPVLPGNLGWQNGAGNVLGTYLHGLFEDAEVIRALFGAATPTLDGAFDRLADCIDETFVSGVLQTMSRSPD